MVHSTGLFSTASLHGAQIRGLWWPMSERKKAAPGPPPGKRSAEDTTRKRFSPACSMAESAGRRRIAHQGGPANDRLPRRGTEHRDDGNRVLSSRPPWAELRPRLPLDDGEGARDGRVILRGESHEGGDPRAHARARGRAARPPVRPVAPSTKQSHGVVADVWTC